MPTPAIAGPAPPIQGGYAVIGKMFPALLYLVVRRDWRAVGWTAGWAVGLTLLTIADVGWAPFEAFRDHLPKLLSGEAFPMLRMPGPSDISLSVPGLLLKLRRFGGPEFPLESLRVTGWICSALLVWVTVRLALRPVARRLALWASRLWMTAGPQSTPLALVAAATTAPIVAILLLFAIAVRVGRRTPTPAAAERLV